MDIKLIKFIDGVALFLSFLIISICLYFYPDFLGHQIATRIVSILMGVMGILGFTVEMSNYDWKSNKKELKKPIGEIIVAFAIFAPFAVLDYLVAHWIVNWIITLVGLFCLYAFLAGVIKIFVLIDFKKGKLIVKLPVLTLNLAVFLLTILQLLQIFKVIDK